MVWQRKASNTLFLNFFNGHQQDADCAAKIHFMTAELCSVVLFYDSRTLDWAERLPSSLRVNPIDLNGPSLLLNRHVQDCSVKPVSIDGV